LRYLGWFLRGLIEIIIGNLQRSFLACLLLAPVLVADVLGWPALAVQEVFWC